MIRLLPTFREWIACLGFAWLFYGGLIGGPLLHQALFFHNVDLNECARAVFYSLQTLPIVAGCGLVVATVLACGLTIVAPWALAPRWYWRSCSAVFGAALALGSVLTNADLRIPTPCI